MPGRPMLVLLTLAGLLTALLPAEAALTMPLPQEAVRVIELPQAEGGRVNSLAFSPDGGQLAAGGSSGIYLFDPLTLAGTGFIPTGTWVRSLAVSADGRTLAAGLFDDTARLWRLPDLQPVRTLEGHAGWVRNVAFHPNGGLLASAADDDTLRVWNTRDGSLMLEIGELQGLRSLAIAPDGGSLALGLMDATIQIRSLADGRLLKTLTGHQDWVRCLAFSPDGRQLASGAFDATARVWDVSSGNLLYTLTDHASSVLDIEFSPDGALLATGSVDGTVRLWNSADGAALRLFSGHAGFVYAVAFSPDGGMLASGAGDNTIRLWDLDAAAEAEPAPPETPSDCRACHHPPSTTRAPAVAEVRCDACHPGGAGLNWCPYFPRSLDETVDTIIASGSAMGRAGVSIPGDSLQVTISSPSNGETLYTHFEYVAPVIVQGRVESAQVPLEEAEIRLQAWSGEDLLASVTQPLSSNGRFEFRLGANPEGYMVLIEDPAAPLNCAACHDDFNVQAFLPAGEIRLVVEAGAKDGDTARDERWVTVDVSRGESIGLEVTDSVSGEPVQGLTIQAFTRLYEWRGRVASTLTDEAGAGDLALEVLSQAPTVYEIQIPDQVVDGTYYSSPRPGTLALGPGSLPTQPDLSMEVDAQRGRIQGTLTAGDQPLPDSIPIRAVGLPAGPAFRTETDKEGRFSFDDLPVMEYLVFAESEALAAHSLTDDHQRIDLTQTPAASVQLTSSLTDGVPIHGMITDRAGEWLPFAWLAVPGGPSFAVDPESGAWHTGPGPQDGAAWLAGAPGYYSREVDFSAEPDEPSVIGLERRPETETVRWGNGKIVVPAGTIARIEEGLIEFETGWIWGEGDSPIRVRTPEAEITLPGGRFALQRISGQDPWFYLFDGQAELESRDSGRSVRMQAGEMTALLRSGTWTAIPYDGEIVKALQPLDGVSTEPVWKPGLAGQVWNWLTEKGITTAQTVTFITYFIAISSLLVLPWSIIRWWWNRRKQHGGKLGG